MFVSDRLIYLEMQKAGSSHARKVLGRFMPGQTRGRHAKLADPTDYRDRLICSSVRNPWDWYVSLFAFGCAGTGGFQKYLRNLPISEVRHALAERNVGRTAVAIARAAASPRRGAAFERLYSDSNNVENFREWLKFLLGAEGQFIVKEGYGTSNIRRCVGFMTYRFLALTTDHRYWQSEGRSARSLADVNAFADRHTIATRILRTETLNADLHDVMQSVGVSVSMETLEGIGRTNSSKHLKYDAYYDAETHSLVAGRDRFIIERFGYGGY